MRCLAAIGSELLPLDDSDDDMAEPHDSRRSWSVRIRVEMPGTDHERESASEALGRDAASVVEAAWLVAGRPAAVPEHDIG